MPAASEQTLTMSPAVRLDQQERRRRTIAAARQVFARAGFAGARSADIARAAGISEGMVWKLFGDKEGLYRAILAEQIEADEGAFRPDDRAAAGDDRGVFAAIGAAMLAAVRRDPCFYRLLYYSALERAGLSAAFAEARFDRVVRYLADYIERRVAEGAFRRVEPRAAALAFIGMIGQYLQVRELFGLEGYDDLDGERYLVQAVDLFLAGLRAHAEGEQ